LEAKARKDARANHICQRKRGAADEADFSKTTHIARTVGNEALTHKPTIRYKYPLRLSLSAERARKMMLFTAGTLVLSTFAISS
jgi:hypothetical protein